MRCCQHPRLEIPEDFELLTRVAPAEFLDKPCRMERSPSCILPVITDSQVPFDQHVKSLERELS